MTVYRVEKSVNASVNSSSVISHEKSAATEKNTAAETPVIEAADVRYSAEAQIKRKAENTEEDIIGKCRGECEKHGVVNRAGFAITERRKNVKCSDKYDRSATLSAERRFIIFGALIIAAGFAAGSVSWLQNGTEADIIAPADSAWAIRDTVKVILPYVLLFAATAYSAFGFMLNGFALYFFAMGSGFKTCSLWNMPRCGSAGSHTVITACVAVSTLVMLLLACRSSAVSGRIFAGEIKRGRILKTLIFAALETAIYITIHNFSVGGFRM